MPQVSWLPTLFLRDKSVAMRLRSSIKILVQLLINTHQSWLILLLPRLGKMPTTKMASVHWVLTLHSTKKSMVRRPKLINVAWQLQEVGQPNSQVWLNMRQDKRLSILWKKKCQRCMQLKLQKILLGISPSSIATPLKPWIIKSPRFGMTPTTKMASVPLLSQYNSTNLLQEEQNLLLQVKPWP